MWQDSLRLGLQKRNTRDNWLQLDSNPQPLSSKTNTQPFSQTSQMIELCWVLICEVHLAVCSCHVTYAFQSKSTLYCCVNVKELLARSCWIHSETLTWQKHYLVDFEMCCLKAKKKSWKNITDMDKAFYELPIIPISTSLWIL